jgi:Spy/CpxP family protein refolding chaperone
MKTKVTLLALAWLASGVAFAADTTATPAAQTEAGPGKRGPDMDRMALLLDLNDYQKTEVEKILKEHHEQMRASFDAARASGTRPTREDMKAQREQSKQELNTKLSGVLTPEQLKKFEALREGGGPRRHFGKDGHDKDDSTGNRSSN